MHDANINFITYLVIANIPSYNFDQNSFQGREIHKVKFKIKFNITRSGFLNTLMTDLESLANSLSNDNVKFCPLVTEK